MAAMDIPVQELMQFATNLQKKDLQQQQIASRGGGANLSFADIENKAVITQTNKLKQQEFVRQVELSKQARKSAIASLETEFAMHAENLQAFDPKQDMLSWYDNAVDLKSRFSPTLKKDAQGNTTPESAVAVQMKSLAMGMSEGMKEVLSGVNGALNKPLFPIVRYNPDTGQEIDEVPDPSNPPSKEPVSVHEMVNRAKNGNYNAAATIIDKHTEHGEREATALRMGYVYDKKNRRLLSYDKSQEVLKERALIRAVQVDRASRGLSALSESQIKSEMEVGRHVAQAQREQMATLRKENPGADPSVLKPIADVRAQADFAKQNAKSVSDYVFQRSLNYQNQNGGQAPSKTALYTWNVEARSLFSGKPIPRILEEDRTKLKESGQVGSAKERAEKQIRYAEIKQALNLFKQGNLVDAGNSGMFASKPELDPSATAIISTQTDAYLKQSEDPDFKFKAYEEEGGGLSGKNRFNNGLLKLKAVRDRWGQPTRNPLGSDFARLRERAGKVGWLDAVFEPSDKGKNLQQSEDRQHEVRSLWLFDSRDEFMKFSKADLEQIVSDFFNPLAFVRKVNMFDMRVFSGAIDYDAHSPAILNAIEAGLDKRNSDSKIGSSAYGQSVSNYAFHLQQVEKAIPEDIDNDPKISEQWSRINKKLLEGTPKGFQDSMKTDPGEMMKEANALVKEMHVLESEFIQETQDPFSFNIPLDPLLQDQRVLELNQQNTQAKLQQSAEQLSVRRLEAENKGKKRYSIVIGTGENAVTKFTDPITLAESKEFQVGLQFDPSDPNSIIQSVNPAPVNPAP